MVLSRAGGSRVYVTSHRTIPLLLVSLGSGSKPVFCFAGGSGYYTKDNKKINVSSSQDLMLSGQITKINKTEHQVPLINPHTK